MKTFTNFSTGKLLLQHEKDACQALEVILKCVAACAPVHKAFRRVDVVGGWSGLHSAGPPHRRRSGVAHHTRLGSIFECLH